MEKKLYLPMGMKQDAGSCVLKKWNKSVGDYVIIGQVLFTFEKNGETHKVSSPKSGVLLKKYYKESETFPDNRPVCVIGKDISYSREDASKKYFNNGGDKAGKMEQAVGIATGQTNQLRTNPSNLLKEAVSVVELFQRQLKGLDSLDCDVSEAAPFVISFAGRFKTGKSSLLNALIGMELLPTRATTATTIVTRIFRGDSLRAWIRENEQNTPISIEAAKKIILNYEPKSTNQLSEVVFEVPIPWLPPHVELRDTPGTSDRLVLEQMTAAALKDTDLCICIYDAAAMLSEAEREGTRRLHKQLGGNLVYAVNRTNLLNSLERIKEVETLSDSFFGSMDYPLNGMGKYYVMCSAPGMIELDGFDVWIKELVKPGNIRFLNQLRHAAVRGWTGEVKEEIRLSAFKFSERLTQETNALEKEHRRIIEDKGHKVKKEADSQALSIRSDMSTAEEKLVNLSGLEEEIRKCMSGYVWQDSYARQTKEATKRFFHARFSQLKRGCKSAQAISGPGFIDNTFSTLSFPEPKFTPIKATGGEIIGGAGIGAVIGSLFLPVVGTAVGAAIGGYIGGGDNGLTNDSVPNTMNYIRSTVVPAVRQSFRSAASSAAKREQQSANEKLKSMKSGLEETLEQLRQSKDMLHKFCVL